MRIPIYAQVAVGGATIFLLVRYIYHELTVGRARRRIIRENGCKPVRRIRSKDPIWGLDLLYEAYRNWGKHNLLNKNVELFQKYGNTVWVRLVGFNSMATIEPENVKTILALKFKDFELGEGRKEGLWPLLGHGIFTSDGEAWYVCHSPIHHKDFIVLPPINSRRLLTYQGTLPSTPSS
jgi:hypothetical protein